MSWEPPPVLRGSHAWITAVIVLLLVVGAGLGVRGWRDGAERPNGRPEDRSPVVWASAPPPVDERDFHVRRFPPLEVVPGRTDPIAVAHGHTLIASEALALHEIDLGSGATRTMSVAGDVFGPLSSELTLVGDGVITTTGEGVLHIDGHAARVRLLAADHRAVPTADDRSVWVSDNVSTPLGGTVTRIGLDGEVIDRLALPARTRPLAGTAERIVVGGPDTVAAIDTDGSGRVLARGDAVASDGVHLAWVDCTADLRCAIVLGTVDDPDRVRMTLEQTDLPSGVFGLPAGAFSPDGRWLAVPLTPPPESGEGPGRRRVTMIDTATGVGVRTLDGRIAGHPPLAWSSDSRWLAVASADHVTLWDATRDELRAVDMDLRRVRGLVFR